MTGTTLFSRFCMLFCLTIICIGSAHAQNAPRRTFVSAQRGVDTNDCSVTSPCRTFARALAVVRANGEVIALDSGAYNTIFIDKSVTVTGPAGVFVGISASAQSAVTVNAPGAIVVLRGLTISGLETAFSGVNVVAVGTLHVESCTINNFTGGAAINAELTNDGTRIFVKDTIMRNNNDGILTTTTNGIVQVSIDRTRAEDNANVAFFALDGSRFTISNSLASRNRVGFLSFSEFANRRVDMNVESCVASNNEFGFAVQATENSPAFMRVTRSIATNNETGFGQFFDGAVFESRGDNLVRGNEADTDGAITVVAST